MSLPEVLSDEEITIVLDLLGTRPGWSELAGSLKLQADAGDSEALRMLGLAFVYDLVSPAHTARRETVGGPYASMWVDAQGSFPPPPGEVVPAVRGLWRRAAADLADPIIAGRIGDLLYVAEGMSAHADARAGAQGLLELATGDDWEPLPRALAMSRSLEVLAELNDSAGLANAVEQAEALVEELLAAERAGPAFAVVRALIGLRRRQYPERMDALMDKVIARHERGDAGEVALGLAAEAAKDQTRKRRLRERQLQIRTEQAASAQGLERVGALQRAIEFANRYGFGAEAKELLAEQQNLPREDLGFEPIQASVEVPSAAVDAEVERVVGAAAAAGDTLGALRRLGAYGPPGGSNEDIDAELAAQNAEHPLLDLFGHQSFGHASSAPTYVANDAESKKLLARGRHREMSADFYGGVLIAPMLDAVPARHGRPTSEQLAEYFGKGPFGPELGERVARAFEQFWDGEYDESAHALVPRLEAALREVARQEGIAIVRPAGEGRFGGVVSLNAVMTELRELFGVSAWLDYLEALLCDPLALNLRNDIAHGLVIAVGRTRAALLLHAACRLALVDETAEE